MHCNYKQYYVLCAFLQALNLDNELWGWSRKSAADVAKRLLGRTRDDVIAGE